MQIHNDQIRPNAASYIAAICLWLGKGIHIIEKGHKAMMQRLLFSMLAMMALPALANVDVLIPSMTNTPNPAIRGGDVTYNITVTNDGSDAAAGVQVRIDLPAGTTNPRPSLGGDPAACSVDGSGTFATCVLPTPLAAHSSVTAQLTVAVGSATASTITIGASVSATNESPNTGANNALSRNTTVNDGADIFLSTVTGSPNPVVGGGNITWSIAGGNNGPSAATNPRVVVELPGSLQFVSGGSAGFDCSASGQLVTCTRSSAIAAGAGGDFAGLQLVTKVVDVASGNVTITPRISSAIDDPNPNNNQLASTPPITISAGADLQVTQTSPISVAVSEQELTFNLQATNNGPSDATSGMQVTYALPIGFDYVSATPTGAGWDACTTAGTVATGIAITCNHPGNYESGRTNPIEIKVKAPTETTAIQDYNLVASITPNPGSPVDPVAANNQSTLPIKVGPDGAGLSISKSRNPNPVAEGQLINNVLQVVNQGPTAVAAASPGTVQITDTINLADEEFVSYSGSGWTCDNVTM